MEKCSKSIIEEFLHINDYKVMISCSDLDHAGAKPDHVGHLFHQLLQAGILSTSQFFKGFSETLEIADDMAIDIPYVWQYIAELVNPVLREGGISLRELLIEFSKPLLPVARAGILFAEILQLLCKQMSQKEVEALWRDSKLSWADFLPETVDGNFISLMKSDDLKRVELRLQTADGLLRRNISTTREVAAGWGTMPAVCLPLSTGENSFELQTVELEMEALEKQSFS
ncbi:eukaryotic translation initiation factor 4 gamma 3-like isoform X2 [Silurus meridionalis]|uniref:eukaryotic translation initiation factor 4 gamma 3-like isoform X2 n=1 Tax=Silurus meridionalis TaxID=175797 RepID=UPI001EE9EBB4|nr:eukaryotic translation initiation factor 4 gamma 3-like isoform X2 [Silurus meridionalis]